MLYSIYLLMCCVACSHIFMEMATLTCDIHCAISCKQFETKTVNQQKFTQIFLLLLLVHFQLPMHRLSSHTAVQHAISVND